MKTSIKMSHGINGNIEPILDMEAENDTDRKLLMRLYRQVKNTGIVYAHCCYTVNEKSQKRGIYKHYYELSLVLHYDPKVICS